jgi:hypothetical protein
MWWGYDLVQPLLMDIESLRAAAGYEVLCMLCPQHISDESRYTWCTYFHLSAVSLFFLDSMNSTYHVWR